MMDALFEEMKACAREQDLPILRDSELPLFTGIVPAVAGPGNRHLHRLFGLADGAVPGTGRDDYDD